MNPLDELIDWLAVQEAACVTSAHSRQDETLAQQDFACASVLLLAQVKAKELRDKASVGMTELPEGGYWAWQYRDANDDEWHLFADPDADTVINEHSPFVRNIVHVSDDHEVTRWEAVPIPRRLESDTGEEPGPTEWLLAFDRSEHDHPWVDVGRRTRHRYEALARLKFDLTTTVFRWTGDRRELRRLPND